MDEEGIKRIKEKKDKLLKKLEKDGFNISPQAMGMLEQMTSTSEDKILEEFVQWYKNVYKNISGSDIVRFFGERGNRLKNVR